MALAADADPGCSLVGVPGAFTEGGHALFARNHDFYPSFRQYSKRYRTDSPALAVPTASPAG